MAELGPDAAYFKCPVSMEGDSVPPEITPVDDAEPISNDVEGPKDVENISKGSHADNGVQVQVDQKVPETHIETAAAAACKDPHGKETIITLHNHDTVIENRSVVIRSILLYPLFIFMVMGSHRSKAPVRS